MRRIALTLAAAAALPLALAGCSGLSTAGSASTGNNATASAKASATATTDASTTLKFGDTYTWSDGLKVSISAPTTFTPTQYASGGSTQNVKFTISVSNGTSSEVSPSLLTIAATANGQAGSNIEDSEGGVSEFPTANTLAPGASTTWSFGFGFADATGVTVTVNPNNITGKTITFKNA